MLGLSNLDSVSRQRIALSTPSGQLMTYEELIVQADALGAQMENRSLVFLLAENSIGSVVGYVACMQHGCVPLLLNCATDDALLNQLYEVYHPRYIWMPEASEKKFMRFAVRYATNGYKLLATDYKKPDLHPDLALLLSTSGSTGSPKLVRLSKSNVEANAESIAQYLCITNDERPITSLPMYYSYGLSVINSHLLRGANILLTNYSVTDKEFWQFAKEQGATSISGVPYTWQMLKMLRFMRMQLPAMTTLTQAGGKLAPELAKEFIDWAAANGKRFYVMYGQTEATARMSYLPWDCAAKKPNSIGVAIPGGRFEVHNAEGRDVTASGEQGELVYFGPNVSLGYAESLADLSLGDSNKGCLHTGDIAKRDDEGCYYIVGRMKRFLKIFGQRIGLDEVENIIRAKYDTDCYCSGTDEQLTVKVTNPVIIEELPMALEQQIHLFHQHIQVLHVDKILRNEVGKVIAQ